jgi:hypothetical protein
MSPASNIETIASQLSDCAAALHRRILLAMRPPAAPQAEIQALFGREVACACVPMACISMPPGWPPAASIRPSSRCWP